MEKRCDLHTHSVYSDGTYTPAQLVAAAEALELGAIALTDHNTVDGLPELMAAGEGSCVNTVPGIELSTEYQGIELHILALFLPREHWDTVSARTADYDRLKEESNICLVETLRRAGYPLDYEAIKATTPHGHINRAHIAAAMTELGYTESVQAAFSTLLSEKHGLYRPPRRPDAFETIGWIRQLGAVSVLAHPFLNLKTEEALRAFLVTAKEWGLDAMETRYPLFDGETTALALRMADEFSLLHSGGSDFHGANKPHIRLGSGRENLEICASVYEKMKILSQSR